MKIYLVGYMFSGKSTVGEKLAKKLSLSFVDTDDLFEEEHQISIPDFFRQADEADFRLLEQKILHKTLSVENAVIATGGGMPCFFDNMEFINDNGISVYLKASPKTVFSRMQGAAKKRPILEAVPKDLHLDFIEKQIASREQFYSLAHISCKTESIDIHSLIKQIREFRTITKVMDAPAV